MRTTATDNGMEAKLGSLVQERHISMRFRYIAPADHTLAMCQEPTYWRHAIDDLARRVAPGTWPGHIIEIICEDGTWEAELRVMEVDERERLVHTRLIYEWHAGGEQAS